MSLGFLDHLLVGFHLLASFGAVFGKFTANGTFQKLAFHANMEHLLALAPSIVEAQHGTSSIAGMNQHGSWGQGFVVLGKAMLDQQLADGICLLVAWHRTGLDGFHFPLQVWWESHGSIPLGTLALGTLTTWHLDHLALWLVWFSLMSIILQMTFIFPIIAMQRQWG